MPCGCGENRDDSDEASDALAEEPNGLEAILGCERCLFREAARMVVLLSTVAFLGDMVGQGTEAIRLAQEADPFPFSFRINSVYALEPCIVYQ